MNYSRRDMLTGAAAAATSIVFAPRVRAATWEPSLDIPDKAVEVLDKSFARYRYYLAGLERLYTGTRWGEGPVYFGDGRYLLWSDTPNNRMLRWDEETGEVRIFRKPSGFANGNTRDRQGRLITCEHVGRRVSRTEYDGTITTLIDHFDGKRLNSPNDVVVKSDNSIWFSDPPSGIVGDYNGRKAKQELPNSVYRLDPVTRKATRVAEEIKRPNGLAFSPDEKLMYLIDVGRGRSFYVYDVVDDGTRLANGRLFYDVKGGQSDGFRVDVNGNLWCGWGGAEFTGVMVLSPAAQPIGRIRLPERCPNVCFGGPKRNRLFMAAAHSLYSIYVNTYGAPGG
jgi:gluconolactonase